MTGLKRIITCLQCGSRCRKLNRCLRPVLFTQISSCHSCHTLQNLWYCILYQAEYNPRDCEAVVCFCWLVLWAGGGPKAIPNLNLVHITGYFGNLQEDTYKVAKVMWYLGVDGSEIRYAITWCNLCTKWTTFLYYFDVYPSETAI